MKKSTLFMACCIGLMLFASCKKDVQPTISIATGTNYVTQNSQVFSGDLITVGFSLAGENLTKIEMNASQNGTVLYNNVQNIDNVATYLYAHSFNIDAVGTVTITGVVTDAKGHSATSSFDILCYEKPNAKFVGHYEGDILITGSYEANVSGMDPIAGDLDNTPLPAVVDIAAGDGMNEVTATITLNEQSNTVNGTVDGNKVVFEAVNSTFNYTYQYQGFPISIPLTMTYTINGTLNGEGEQLDLDGECNGEGNILAFGTFSMEGTLGGSLNKTR
jgi:hypothetical protein